MLRVLALCSLALIACGPPASGGPDGGGGNDACRDTSKSPANLVANPGFECGGAAPTEWSPIFGTLDMVSDAPRSGTRAAKLTMTDALGGRFAYAVNVPTGGTKTWCFNAWIRGTAPHMRLAVMRDDNTRVDFSSPVAAAWALVKPTKALDVANQGSSKLVFFFEMQTTRGDNMNAKPGDTLFVDDVDVWESPSGSCAETR